MQRWGNQTQSGAQVLHKSVLPPLALLALISHWTYPAVHTPSGMLHACSPDPQPYPATDTDASSRAASTLYHITEKSKKVIDPSGNVLPLNRLQINASKR